jgi:uncharacterized protein
MHFVLYCIDKTGHQQLRAANRPAHLEYLKGYLGQIVMAGALLDDAGKEMIGSLFILDFPDRAAVNAFAAGDPYAKAGLFASARIAPWRKVIPAS